MENVQIGGHCGWKWQIKVFEVRGKTLSENRHDTADS